ncbi:MAG: YraN family protein [Chloroflexota bacterium]
MNRRDTGMLGEKLARSFLEERGYRVIGTNYRSPEGEIDIITLKADWLIFVEVRTKKSLRFGSPEESVTRLKKEHLIACAERYRQEHNNLPELWRIDFVAVELTPAGKLRRIALIENAVSES